MTSPSMTSPKQPSATFVTIVCSLGILLSSYALYVEHRTSHQSEENDSIETPFVALCDIESIGASCSSVFALPEGRMLSYFSIVPHGHIFDVPNAALGFLYYTFMLSLEHINYHYYHEIPCKLHRMIAALRLCVSLAAMSSSVFLASRLIVLEELCLLCWSTHIFNLLLLQTFVNRSRSVFGQSTGGTVANGAAIKDDGRKKVKDQ
mmetsp:Transcript_19651/g.27633  ORF Transcript_19651/g.27633 Transcript_19651/m.27633 type:complete len:206 (-) Transcript_19651:75-692(-)